MLVLYILFVFENDFRDVEMLWIFIVSFKCNFFFFLDKDYLKICECFFMYWECRCIVSEEKNDILLDFNYCMRLMIFDFSCVILFLYKVMFDIWMIYLYLLFLVIFDDVLVLEESDNEDDMELDCRISSMYILFFWIM